MSLEGYNIPPAYFDYPNDRNLPGYTRVFDAIKIHSKNKLLKEVVEGLLDKVLLCRTRPDAVLIAKALLKARIVALTGVTITQISPKLSKCEYCKIDAFAGEPKDWTRDYVANSYENTQQYCVIVDERVKVCDRPNSNSIKYTQF